MNFDNHDEILEELINAFPKLSVVNIPIEVHDAFEGRVVYDFFHGKTWTDLAMEINFSESNEALDKGVLYLGLNEFKYYMPFYVYGSLLNDGWVFEYSFFLHYLTPGVMDDASFIDGFDDVQQKILYEFVYYKANEKFDLLAIDAFESYWILHQE